MPDGSNLSAVVPWRTDGGPRARLAAWTFARLAALWPAMEVLLGDPHEDAPWFSRARAVNDGAARATRPLLLVVDADVVVLPAATAAAAAHVEAEGGWALPYETYATLDEASTARLVGGPPRTVSPEDAGLEPSGLFPGSRSGALIIGRALFDDLGGFDERFVGWAPEDLAFADAATALAGAAWRAPGTLLWHLWHPPAKGSHDSRVDLPWRAANDALAARYRAAADAGPAAIRALLAERA